MSGYIIMHNIFKLKFVQWVLIGLYSLTQLLFKIVFGPNDFKLLKMLNDWLFESDKRVNWKQDFLPRQKALDGPFSLHDYKPNVVLYGREP